MITTITGKNQVTVPAAIVSQAKIQPGTRLDWQLGDEEATLLVRVLPDTATVASRLRGQGLKFKRRGRTAVANLVRERIQEDQERG